MAAKLLHIVRHGKSSWEEEGLDDIDRPLAERGNRNAVTMAQRLSEMNAVPRLLFTSPANRALNTALIMSRIWKLPPSALQIHDELYMAYEDEIDEVVARAPAEVTDLAIFGHNPSFTLYANFFLKDPLDNLPTAGVVIVTLESDSWKAISSAKVKETCLDYPKRKQ
jgi:phosphohistidine phosphatase